ncbi:MAG: hydroxyisourate hydrolase [Pseudomonadota bacterium]
MSAAEHPTPGLTTHVLDTAQGKPGAGIKVELWALDGGARLIASAITDADGRTERPLLTAAAMRPGRYRLDFHVGAYFAAAGFKLPDPKFLDVVAVAFGIADAGGRTHVPLLVSPWGYTTYRGS